jgi:hypothetical protein
MTGRLIVVGDSFCVLAGPQDPFRNWCQQAAQLLDRTLLVTAGPGVSQDWQWDQLMKLWPTLTPEDRVVVVITHCERQWFVQDQPGYTHVNIGNLPDVLGESVAQAIQDYCVHLQRPELDLQHQTHRLGWLSAQVQRSQVHPVWVLPAFSLHWLVHRIATSTAEYYDNFQVRGLPNLWLTEQNLYDHVQELEMQEGENTNSVFQGVDTRYNHLLRHNHEILAHRVVQAIQQDRPIELTDPRWRRAVLHPSIWQDVKFIQTEMDSYAVQRREEILKKYQGSLLDKTWMGSWLKNRK